ncbi:hypothetical protein GS429_18125 [Natronorubrum sp. JWXQ-INN-674]|uniref:Uncharacterized protein n=1 Tax=Natronorubrum halalkaliphilum TaxID=2691917 RepID=A0A6B0VR38_9EURY|nr:hypothetical protein [Natronorubrum halalkaliphilum]
MARTRHSANGYSNQDGRFWTYLVSGSKGQSKPRPFQLRRQVYRKPGREALKTILETTL